MIKNNIEYAIVLDSGNAADANKLAQELNWPLQKHFANCDAAIVFEPQGVALWSKDAGRFLLDFVQGKQAYRLQQQVGKNELLVKAVCGSKKLAEVLEGNPWVLDLTAGFGRDALLLMNAGFQLLLCERELPVYLLLEQALRRLQLQEPVFSPESYRIINADLVARFVEQKSEFSFASVFPHSPQPAIVYCDPMFPVREKSAKVKKESQILQSFARETNEADLLSTALLLAKEKVVVKRPVKAPVLGCASVAAAGVAQLKPAYSVKGKTIRYDVYLC